MAEQKILVTGAGGWLASHTVWQLLEAGYSVRGTVRDPDGEKYAFLKEESFHPKAKTHLELVKADLLRPDDWHDVVSGCDAVLHMASPFKMTADDVKADIITPAVEGVRNVISACRNDCGLPKRIILTSSVVSVVYGHQRERYACDRAAVDRARDDLVTKLRHEGCDGPVCGSTGTEWAGWKLLNEEDWSVKGKVEGYDLSKRAAEKLAWRMVESYNSSVGEEDKLELVTLCPGFVFGPCLASAHQYGESSQQIMRLMNRDYPIVPPLTSAHVDVRDVALCHVKALKAKSRDVAGQRFIIAATDGNLTFSEQAQLLARHFGPRGWSIPTYTAPKFAFYIGSLFSSLFQVVAIKADDLAWVSNAKASEVLGMTSWRSTSLALRTHALSLMKFGALPLKGVSKEEVDSCPTTL